MQLSPSYPVRTRRFRLRPLGLADADAVAADRSRPKVCLYVPFEPMDREAIPRHITVRWARQRITAEGKALFLGAELASVGEVIGDVTLWFQSAERRPGEVGWVFNRDHSRKGYATEAVQRRPASAKSRTGPGIRGDLVGPGAVPGNLPPRSEQTPRLAWSGCLAIHTKKGQTI